MPTRDPKVLAAERFANPEPLVSAIEVIGRCATDPPLVVRGLLDAIDQRVELGSQVAELGFGSGWLLAEVREHVPGISVIGLAGC
jgi:tRNA G46 methylase TrmB